MQNVTRSEDGYNLNITVNKMFTVCGDGYWSDTAKQVYVESITMFVANEADYSDGDLGVHYNTDTWNDEELGLIYTDSAFLADVQTTLIKAGISIEAAEAVTYSEQGMQDEGRVSCDAYALADYVRARMQTVAA
jgi:hypothetical protein